MAAGTKIRQFRTTDNQVPIDSAGAIPRLGAFSGAASMLTLASKIPYAHACYAAHLPAHLKGTSQVQTTASSRWPAPAVAHSLKGASVRGLVIDLVQMDAFVTISR